VVVFANSLSNVSSNPAKLVPEPKRDNSDAAVGNLPDLTHQGHTVFSCSPKGHLLSESVEHPYAQATDHMATEPDVFCPDSVRQATPGQC